MNLVEFLVLALAVWRLSSMLVNESGPWGVFEHIRYAAGVRYDEESERYATNEFAKVFVCMWCSSVWVSFAIAGLWYFAPVPLFIFCLPFALSAVAIALQETIDHE
jgi:hypothetical protein